MAARVESRKSIVETAKLIFAIGLLVGGIAGFYYFSGQALVYRVLIVLGSSVAAFAMVLYSAMGKALLSFVKDARVEVRKVVWPTRQETVQATLIVVALVFLVGVILWFLDMGLFWGVSLLTGQGK